MTKEDIKIITSGTGMLQFSASWCGPCKALSRTFNENTEKLNKVKRIYVDLDRNQDLAAEYSVSSVPTLILFKEGKEARRLIGNKSLEDLVNFIND
jgi:thioredoxin 1